MKQTLLPILLLMSCAARAGDMKPLDDEALGQVSARDGVSIAAHIVINDPTLVGAVADSRMSMGFGGDGAYRYVVLKNVRGVVDMAGVHIDAAKKPDGTDYVAVTLPGYLKFTNLGFESLSVQSDPLAPVTSSMGSVNINGTLNMQGQFRIWAH
ncbi:hypothetical protein GJ700_27565 [Duganella sp. FT92W]|uniref:DUF6160 domain-containing protein n=1 Tax=Pseudoduganella rivuli TaxID=2666085 RepID=A0A7X2IT11_9BURK|nr:DUF6160 family protein [Pseudoduganella rivuli]MRV75484.1 hypothetical protein [Pseudoduganella rivuli]